MSVMPVFRGAERHAFLHMENEKKGKIGRNRIDNITGGYTK